VLALVLTLALAVYVFGPDAFSRFLLDFSVPRRAVTLTKSEEVYRAIVWSSVCLALAYVWARAWGTLDRLWDWGELRTFVCGIYSEDYFRHNTDAWFHSLHSTVWMNFCILWRLYAVVLILSLVLHTTIKHYARVRDWLRKRKWRWLADRSPKWLAALVLPRIAPWHVLLSQILIGDKSVQLHVDVMTKSDVLYQGLLADKTLSADGALVSIVLADPRRFRYAEYVEAKKSGESIDKAAYWRPIPTNMFIVTGSEIATMNLRYVPDDVGTLKQGQPQGSDLQNELDEINRLVQQLLTDSNPD
jgi:hypothetical protein